MLNGYNLILYYRLTVSNIMYLIKKNKNLKCFYTTHIHYRRYRKYGQLYIAIIERLNY